MCWSGNPVWLIVVFGIIFFNSIFEVYGVSVGEEAMSMDLWMVGRQFLEMLRFHEAEGGSVFG